MKFWVPLICLPTEEYLPLAEAAERLGFAGVLLADHLAVPDEFASVHPSGENPFSAATEFPDPVTMIATLAARTERLRFITYTYILPMRDPFTVAKQFGTLAQVMGGRVSLGCAVGWLREEFELLGQDFGTRGARTDEAIAIIRDFWDDGWAEHHGRFYDFDRTGMFPRPDVRVPVLIGGAGRRALERAVRNDGWLGMNYSWDDVEDKVGTLHRLRKKAGLDGGEFTVFVVANAAPSEATYARLRDMGVTDTLAAAWQAGQPGQPDTETLEDRIAHLEKFAARYL
ncbi:TIGR03619 family F420-dependent LLM class oxidoreductase [Yinghuangia sp. YIM S09857]|uniref:TIGR03619 family F420-dependent LLM class oxidoreductase n=1 Tax=Yinghuangia sp. YIM S09857 TaxID=3436929 RepID=UPI003F53DC1C